MRWIIAPDWSDPVAQRLHSLLRKSIDRSEDIQQICREIGLDPGRLCWGEPSGALWPAVTHDAAEIGRLDVLVWKVRERRPALASEFDAILEAETASESWYYCEDPFRSKLVGPNNSLAVLDRDGLRAGLIAIARQDYPVLAIYGPAGSGRSYSKRILQHVAMHTGHRWEPPVIVDAEEHLPNPAHAGDLLKTLADMLHLPLAVDVDELTENTAKARGAVTAFVGMLSRCLPRGRRLIFLDSLDRQRVQPDLLAAVGHLAWDIANGALGETRLIVTGHPGDFKPDVLDVLRREEITPIAQPQVRAFFRGIAQDMERPLDPADLVKLVAEVDDEARGGGLRELGLAASHVAHRYFGGAE
jgi:hypothetical protein